MEVARDPAGRHRREGGQFSPFGSSPFDLMAVKLVGATYQAVLALVAALHGLDINQVRVQLARPLTGGAPTADRTWMAASRVRDMALYLVNTVLDVDQHLLWRAAGISQQHGWSALRRVEDRRDDPAVEHLIGIAERLVKGN